MPPLMAHLPSTYSSLRVVPAVKEPNSAPSLAFALIEIFPVLGGTPGVALSTAPPPDRLAMAFFTATAESSFARWVSDAIMDCNCFTARSRAAATSRS